MASTWSMTDASSNGFTLTNSNLTVQATAGGWKSVRGTNSQSSGKFYVELSVSTVSDGTNLMLGLADATFNAGSYAGSNTYSVSLQPSQGGYNSAGFALHYGVNTPAAAGDVWGIAVDFGAGNAWVAQNNAWAASGNPATGSLPSITFTPATVGALFPVLSLDGASSGVWTLQPSAASQKYAPPSGFGAWDAPTVNYVDLVGNFAV